MTRPILPGNRRACRACGAIKPLSDYRFLRKRGRTSTTCPPCEAAEKKTYYAKMRADDPLRWRVQVIKCGRSKYVTADWLLTTLESQGHKCALSGRAIDIDSMEVDHIIPRKFGGTDELHNLQLLCPEANRAKGILMRGELLDLCRDILVNSSPDLRALRKELDCLIHQIEGELAA